MSGVRVVELGPGSPAPAVLLALHARALTLGLAPPAALTGSWFGSAAVLAPSVEVVAGALPPAAGSGGGGPGPVGGGWVGYLGYPDRRADAAPALLPGSAGGWTSCVLRLDAAGCWWWESLDDDDCPAWAREALASERVPGAGGSVWVPPDRVVHRAGVLDCLARIAEGELYQACVCARFTGTVTDPVSLFARGVTRFTPARGAFLAGSWGAVASFSPELFLARHGRDVTSSPIKGTLPRRGDPAQLRSSAKDVAENVMIVDLVRNDLGRVAVPGSTRVPELLAVHPAPGVWHLVSTVTARLREGVDDEALLGATFPPASVTGTPKHAARGLVAQWEHHQRGLHCGAVGLVSPVAGAEWSVAIRTVEVGAGGAAALGVGGGITIDSDPDAEWQELLDKAAAVLALG